MIDEPQMIYMKILSCLSEKVAAQKGICQKFSKYANWRVGNYNCAILMLKEDYLKKATVKC